MPHVTRDQIGTVPCLCCSQVVPVKKGAGGAISASCQWCDVTLYAKKDTQAAKIIMKKMTPTAPEPAPGAPPAPAGKKDRDKIPGVDS